MITALYGKDLRIASTSERVLVETKEILGKPFRSNDLRESRTVLGTHIFRKLGRGMLHSLQERNVLRVGERFGMKDSRGRYTSTDLNINWHDGLEAVNVPYRVTITSVMSLAIESRPNIAYGGLAFANLGKTLAQLTGQS